MTTRTIKRRRREGKTDYRLRMSLLKSGKPRIVVRKTNKYWIVQAVESNEAQDKVLVTISSKDLLKQGWNEKNSGSLKSVPAAHLTGMLMGKTLKGEGEYILDLGMARTLAGSRIFAVVKGLIDGGLNINANEKVFPSEERLNGEHLKDEVKTNIEKVKSNLEKL